MVNYFNPFGFIIVYLMMIPNIIYAVRCKDKFKNKKSNKLLKLFEQIGWYGCIIFMIIIIPDTLFGWWSDEAFTIYLIFNIILVLLYWLFWIICYKKNNINKALSLSIIPSIIFLFSGIMSRSILLIIFSIIFSISQITISYKK